MHLDVLPPGARAEVQQHDNKIKGHLMPTSALCAMDVDSAVARMYKPMAMPLSMVKTR
jgi:hypothetical protein